MLGSNLPFLACWRQLSFFNNDKHGRWLEFVFKKQKYNSSTSEFCRNCLKLNPLLKEIGSKLQKAQNSSIISNFPYSLYHIDQTKIYSLVCLNLDFKSRSKILTQPVRISLGEYVRL